MVVTAIAAFGFGMRGPRDPQTVNQRVHHVTSQLRCPVCQGETIADSNAVISQEIRALVEQRVVKRESESQINAFIVHHYPGTLMTPPDGGLGLIVWGLPVAAFAAASGGLVFAFRGWHRPNGVVVTDADRVLVDQAQRAALNDLHTPNG